MTLHVGKKRFRLGSPLGSGAFGEIYEGHDVHTKNKVAVKLESLQAPHPQLLHEARIYHTLQHLPTVPRMHYFGKEGDYYVLVLDKLGSNLETYMQATPNKRLSLSHVLTIADQMLRALEPFHDFGFVHRDIKPDNILLDTSQRRLFLMDFGLSKFLREPDTGRHIPHRTGKSLTGTPRYASIPNHLGHEQGRRDDLESLGYVLIYLLQGSLPWQNTTRNATASPYAAILQQKEDSHRKGTLCRKLPGAFRRYFRHVLRLPFAERPDYQHLRRLFEKERTDRKLATVEVF